VFGQFITQQLAGRPFAARLPMYSCRFHAPPTGLLIPGFKENEISKNVPQSLSGWPGVSGSGSGWSRHTAKTED